MVSSIKWVKSEGRTVWIEENIPEGKNSHNKGNRWNIQRTGSHV